MLPPLTDREKQVLELIANGFTNKEIALNLWISESTVENHIHHIYVKLRISNRARAVAYALQSRLALLASPIEDRGNPP
jgi:two-component system, NarL family, response regulator DegU